MERFGRDAPLPSEMQGRWHDADGDGSTLIIDCGEVRYLGQAIPYDYKLVDTAAGALVVSLKIDDAAGEDDFQRSHITELVITPEGEFHAYNVKFAAEFVRATN